MPRLELFAESNNGKFEMGNCRSVKILKRQIEERQLGKKKRQDEKTIKTLAST